MPAGALVRRHFNNTISTVLRTVLTYSIRQRVGKWSSKHDNMTIATMKQKFEQCLTHLRMLETQNAQRNVPSTENSLRDMVIGIARDMRRELGVSNDCLIVRGTTELPVEFRRGANKATSANNSFGLSSEGGRLVVSNSDDRDKLYAIYRVVSPFLKALYDGLQEKLIRQCMQAILLVDPNKFEAELSVANTSEN